MVHNFKEVRDKIQIHHSKYKEYISKYMYFISHIEIFYICEKKNSFSNKRIDLLLNS